MIMQGSLFVSLYRTTSKWYGWGGGHKSAKLKEYLTTEWIVCESGLVERVKWFSWKGWICDVKAGFGRGLTELRRRGGAGRDRRRVVRLCRAPRSECRSARPSGSHPLRMPVLRLLFLLHFPAASQQQQQSNGNQRQKQGVVKAWEA